ncbi:hypothetical protein ACFQ8C_37105 [Streptomyces sp. NPDC056503]|uniref:hypothetical protein n=1 Tax=Streptomyces sp. NPDC056503 TaxID=3345842 RepID=UPI0036CDAA21
MIWISQSANPPPGEDLADRDGFGKRGSAVVLCLIDHALCLVGQRSESGQLSLRWHPFFLEPLHDGSKNVAQAAFGDLPTDGFSVVQAALWGFRHWFILRARPPWVEWAVYRLILCRVTCLLFVASSRRGRICPRSSDPKAMEPLHFG